MDKTAAPPDSEEAANAKKHETDSAAGEILGLDPNKTDRVATEIASIIKVQNGPKRIVIAGGAGSGKSTLSRFLSGKLRVKRFDLDEYIEGGFHKDPATYDSRLNAALYLVWKDMPDLWILEHVEACRPFIIHGFRPSYTILVDPGAEHLKKTAAARNLAGKNDPDREKRAMDTMKTSAEQFKAVKGTNIRLRDPHFLMKRIEG